MTPLALYVGSSGVMDFHNHYPISPWVNIAVVCKHKRGWFTIWIEVASVRERASDRGRLTIRGCEYMISCVDYLSTMCKEWNLKSVGWIREYKSWYPSYLHIVACGVGYLLRISIHRIQFSNQRSANSFNVYDDKLIGERMSNNELAYYQTKLASLWLTCAYLAACGLMFEFMLIFALLECAVVASYHPLVSFHILFIDLPLQNRSVYNRSIYYGRCNCLFSQTPQLYIIVV